MPLQKRHKVAFCYDFDGTLSPGNMQEYDFMKKLNMSKDNFWKKSHQIMKAHSADSVLAYMRLMIEESINRKIAFTRKDFQDYGRHVPLYKGVSTWFERINAYAAARNLDAEHYIISSGIREMILGNPISKNFKKIYASSFMYDKDGNAKWPAVVLNYTTKTQCIFRINKGCLSINDPDINAFIPDKDRYIPLSRMVYIGDGETDVPCMRLVKNADGYSVALYQPENEKKKQIATQLLKDQRVNFIAPADYSAHTKMEKIVQTILDKIALDLKIDSLRQD